MLQNGAHAGVIKINVGLIINKIYDRAHKFFAGKKERGTRKKRRQCWAIWHRSLLSEMTWKFEIMRSEWLAKKASHTNENNQFRLLSRACQSEMSIFQAPFHVLITLAAASSAACSIMIIYWASKYHSTPARAANSLSHASMNNVFVVFVCPPACILPHLNWSSSRFVCVFSQLLQSAFLWCYK